ncbi:MAG TPA: class I SAM-dependent rRNA methyltransferase [Terriglobales bacterium]
MEDRPLHPIVTVSRRGAERLRAGHDWIYRSDVIDASNVPPGSLVTVRAGADKSVRATHILGSAFYSTASEIAIRMISAKPVDDVHQLLRERIRAAIAYRERFVRDTNAYRVVFSEGDFLPGLIVDRYNDVISFQVLTQAMDSTAMRETFLSELRSALSPAAIVERVDARVRKLEQLPERRTAVVWSSSHRNAIPSTESKRKDEEPAAPSQEAGSPALTGPGMTGEEQGQPPIEETGKPVTTEFHMNGVRFLFDALAGQKTGAFLDQRENYAAAAQYARGEALDVFCYQGGFALHLGPACDQVTGVDSSRPALESAEQNAKLNGREVEWIEANAFDLLRDYSDAGRQYDTVVLDPPAFAKSRRDAPAALRAYKELNLRALKMLRPGGILVTCSCSYHVSASDLLEVVGAAGLDSHRNLRVLENRGQAKDHPNILGIPETAYLKCLIVLSS